MGEDSWLGRVEFNWDRAPICWLESQNVSGKALAAGFCIAPAASALPLSDYGPEGWLIVASAPPNLTLRVPET